MPGLNWDVRCPLLASISLMVWVMAQKRIYKIYHQWRHLGLDTGLCVQPWPGSLTHLHLTRTLDSRYSVQCTDSPFYPGLEPSEDGIEKKLYWKGIKVWDVCIIDVEGPCLNREKAAGSIGKGYTVKIWSMFWARASRQNFVEPNHCWIVNPVTIFTYLRIVWRRSSSGGK